MAFLFIQIANIIPIASMQNTMIISNTIKPIYTYSDNNSTDIAINQILFNMFILFVTKFMENKLLNHYLKFNCFLLFIVFKLFNEYMHILVEFTPKTLHRLSFNSRILS